MKEKHNEELPKFNSVKEEKEFYSKINKLARHMITLIDKLKAEKELKEKLDNDFK